MRIISKSDRFIAFPLRNMGRVEWIKGSHTANVLSNTGEALDVFTFAWEKDRASMLDFTTALEGYLADA